MAASTTAQSVQAALARLYGLASPTMESLQVPAACDDNNLKTLYARQADVLELLSVHAWLKELGLCVEDPLSGVVVGVQLLSGHIKLRQVAGSTPRLTSTGVLDAINSSLELPDGSSLPLSRLLDKLPEQVLKGVWLAAVKDAQQQPDGGSSLGTMQEALTCIYRLNKTMRMHQHLSYISKMLSGLPMSVVTRLLPPGVSTSMPSTQLLTPAAEALLMQQEHNIKARLQQALTVLYELPANSVIMQIQNMIHPKPAALELDLAAGADMGLLGLPAPEVQVMPQQLPQSYVAQPQVQLPPIAQQQPQQPQSQALVVHGSGQRDGASRQRDSASTHRDAALGRRDSGHRESTTGHKEHSGTSHREAAANGHREAAANGHREAATNSRREAATNGHRESAPRAADARADDRRVRRPRCSPSPERGRSSSKRGRSRSRSPVHGERRPPSLNDARRQLLDDPRRPPSLDDARRQLTQLRVRRRSPSPIMLPPPSQYDARKTDNLPAHWHLEAAVEFMVDMKQPLPAGMPAQHRLELLQVACVWEFLRNGGGHSRPVELSAFKLPLPLLLRGESAAEAVRRALRGAADAPLTLDSQDRVHLCPDFIRMCRKHSYLREQVEAAGRRALQWLQGEGEGVMTLDAFLELFSREAKLYIELFTTERELVAHVLGIHFKARPHPSQDITLIVPAGHSPRASPVHKRRRESSPSVTHPAARREPSPPFVRAPNDRRVAPNDRRVATNDRRVAPTGSGRDAMCGAPPAAAAGAPTRTSSAGGSSGAGRTLAIGNLPPLPASKMEQLLTGFFGRFGQLEGVTVPSGIDGHGYVTFKSNADALEVLQRSVDGKRPFVVQERRLEVALAPNRRPRTRTAPADAPAATAKAAAAIAAPHADAAGGAAPQDGDVAAVLAAAAGGEEVGGAANGGGFQEHGPGHAVAGDGSSGADAAMEAVEGGASEPAATANGNVAAATGAVQGAPAQGVPVSAEGVLVRDADKSAERMLAGGVAGAVEGVAQSGAVPADGVQAQGVAMAIEAAVAASGVQPEQASPCGPAASAERPASRDHTGEHAARDQGEHGDTGGSAPADMRVDGTGGAVVPARNGVVAVKLEEGPPGAVGTVDGRADVDVFSSHAANVGTAAQPAAAECSGHSVDRNPSLDQSLDDLMRRRKEQARSEKQQRQQQQRGEGSRHGSSPTASRSERPDLRNSPEDDQKTLSSVFVCNLPYKRATVAALQQVFMEYGFIEHIKLDLQQGAWAVVKYRSAKDAQSLLQRHSEGKVRIKLQDRDINIKPYRPPPPKSSTSNRGYGQRGGGHFRGGRH